MHVISFVFEKSPIGKYFWIYRDTCWFNITVLSCSVVNTGITFVDLETIQNDIHFGDYQLFFCVWDTNLSNNSLQHCTFCSCYETWNNLSVHEGCLRIARSFAPISLSYIGCFKLKSDYRHFAFRKVPTFLNCTS